MFEIALRVTSMLRGLFSIAFLKEPEVFFEIHMRCFCVENLN